MSAKRYALFLRGVNVGGVTLKMTEVTAALTDAGFSRVRTILASGNVLLDSDAPAAAVRQTAQTVLRARFGYDAWVLVYDLDTVRAVIGAYPFEPEVAGQQSYVTFVADTATLDELVARIGATGPDEKVARGDGVLYWQVPKGETLSSTPGKVLGTPRYKPAVTTRNLRTLGKVVAGSVAR